MGALSPRMGSGKQGKWSLGGINWVQRLAEPGQILAISHMERLLAGERLEKRRHREPSLPQLERTHGHKGLGGGCSEPAPQRSRPKVSLTHVTLQPQAWEGDQPEGGSGWWSSARIWESKELTSLLFDHKLCGLG